MIMSNLTSHVDKNISVRSVRSFELFCRLHPAPVLEINQQKRKSVPVKFCHHQIPIKLPLNFNISRKFSVTFINILLVLSLVRCRIWRVNLLFLLQGH